MNWTRVLVAFTVLSTGAAVYFGMTYIHSKKVASDRVENLTHDLTTAMNRVKTLEEDLTGVENELKARTEERDSLEEDLRKEQKINSSFEDQIADIGSTVGTLDKLAKADPKLLQKYSKVYFLNEHYVPEKVVQIDSKYVFGKNTPRFIHAKVRPFLADMMDAAHDDDISLFVASAYRSFDEQASLKGQYAVTYGSGANTFSADQGYSEHQLGTTVDFTTESLQGALDGFANTPAYEWLKKNAYRYGFVLSYPPNNAYYVFEPWHWRFVGEDLARYLRNNNEDFYDLDQRKIDTYLISMFDD